MEHYSAPSPPLVTKDNIQSFSFYQLFNIPDPVLDKDHAAAAAGDDKGIIDAPTLTRAYRRFSLLFHPDKDDSPQAREAFEYVKTALETLIDEEKRLQYDAGRGGTTAIPGGEDAKERQRQQQAAEDAEWAAQILKDREAQQVAARTAKEKAAAERDEAMRRMQAELTSSLDTPFAMMESEVIRDWDVDEELLSVKLRDVDKLLGELAVLTGDHDSASGTKRRRVEVGRDTSDTRGVSE